MPVTVITTEYTPAAGAGSAVAAAVRTYPWKARVFSNKLCNVLVNRAGTKETGTIAFGAVADDGDIVTIDDGVTTPVVFTFGDGMGGTVDKGATAADSADNLKTAIEAAVVAGTLDVSVAIDTATLTIVNNNYVGGTISKTDADNDYVVTNFSGGVGGVAGPGDYPINALEDEVMHVAAGHVLTVRLTSAGALWISEVA